MVVELGQYQLDIDVDKTREAYKAMRNLTEGCSCQGCRNYEKAVEVLPKEVWDFFDMLGIDMKKVTEVYVNTANLDGTLFYGGFYHLCGQMLAGKSAWVPSGASMAYYDWAGAYEITKEFSVSFQEDCHLLEDGFPFPVLQMEFTANIPFVLDEKNSWL